MRRGRGTVNRVLLGLTVVLLGAGGLPAKRASRAAHRLALVAPRPGAAPRAAAHPLDGPGLVVAGRHRNCWPSSAATGCTPSSSTAATEGAQLRGRALEAALTAESRR
ncbi:hypothetical protein [Streptomyces sp. bgisy084]|uniref:hypothetical protein n=1 Tax=Streptomyces sp. bgisy084 TaxID=3413777 RepID=UPI003D7467B0